MSVSLACALHFRTRRQLKRFLWLALLLTLTPMMAGCDAIQGIFKAGFFVGVIAVVLIVGAVGFLVMKMR